MSRRRLLTTTAGTVVGADLMANVGWAAASSSASSGGGEDTRKVMSDSGLVEVPARPERVVCAIGSFEVDVVAVGVMPVMTTRFAGPWVELDDTVTITENVPPTPEELARIEPDVIVGWSWVSEEPMYESIVQLAPYVGLGESVDTVGAQYADDGLYQSWDTLFLSVCDVVGRRAEGELLVAEFDARLDALRERRAGGPELTVARVQFYEQGTFSYRGLNEDTAELMRRIGLVPVGPDVTDNQRSMERLGEIDADVILVPVGGGMPADLFEEVEANPLWQLIPAVQRGDVVVVDGELWPGLGYLWAQAVTDDMERLFVR